jgi:phospholipase C
MFSRRTFLQVLGASAGLAVTGLDSPLQAGAQAAPAAHPNGSGGIEHVVVLMMENRSFDHFLGWLPGAHGRHNLTYLSTDGNVYPNYPLAPDFQGCGYSDPDHSWEGFLVQYNFGKMDGFLQRPTPPPNNPGVKPAAANTLPIGYYTNRHHDGSRKALPDLPVVGALAEHYTVLDHYFCSFAGETFPNRFYQHSARTDRDHNGPVPPSMVSTLPAIWDQLSPIPNTKGVPTGGYFFRDLPFLGLWGTKYLPFWHPFASSDAGPIEALLTGLGLPSSVLASILAHTFLDVVRSGSLPNVSFVDPAFITGDNGTSGDDHPLSDIRLGERFIADAYHALYDAGYLDNTVLMVTFDEWGGFFDHVPPPQVIDDTDPTTVDHTGDGTTPTDGRLIPDYRQLGFRVPAIVVSNRAPARIAHHGPFEHTSTLALIESTFGLAPLTARDAHALNLSQVLLKKPRRPVPAGAIPTSSQVLGPPNDAAAVCSAHSTPSVSPAPLSHGHRSERQATVVSAQQTGNGMVAFANTHSDAWGARI